MRCNRIGGSCAILLAMLAGAPACLAQTPAAMAQPAAAAPAAETPDPALAAEQQRLAQAIDLLGEKKPKEAILVLDQVIARFEQAHSGDKMRIYCARTPA